MRYRKLAISRRFEILESVFPAVIKTEDFASVYSKEAATNFSHLRKQYKVSQRTSSITYHGCSICIRNHYGGGVRYISKTREHQRSHTRKKS